MSHEKAPRINNGEWTVKKLLIAAGFLAVATSTAWAHVYGYWTAPYGWGAGFYNCGGPYASQPYAARFYNCGGPYASQPYAAPPSYYGYDPYGTAHNWDYYRVDRPGRGNDVESTR